MHYRKKPVVVNAVQFFDNTPTPGVYGGFVNQRHCIACLPEKNYKVSGPAVITIHGHITPVTEGDWIIDEGDGLHFYPCKPDIFAATYEPVQGKANNMLSDEDAFVLSFNSVAERINQWAITKGWNDKEVPMSESIALMHSELSEALEGDRHGNPPSDKIPNFSSVEEEFADVIIRIMHVAARNNIKVAEALVAKLEYNNNRSYKHGGKAY